MRPLVAEFIGPTGSGKTTLCRATAEALRTAGFEVVTSAPRGVKLSTRRRLQTRLAAWWLSRLMRTHFGDTYDFGYWMQRLERTISLYAAPGRSLPTFILSDEGVTQIIRKCRRPLPSALFLLIPLPDAVVHVQAPWLTAKSRSLARKENAKTITKVRGKMRWIRAVNRTIAVLHRGYPEHEVFDYIERWNKSYCDPPLSGGDLAAVLADAKSLKPPESGGGTKKIRKAFEARHVNWIEIYNPDGRKIESSVSDLVNNFIKMLSR